MRGRFHSSAAAKTWLGRLFKRRERHVLHNAHLFEDGLRTEMGATTNSTPGRTRMAGSKMASDHDRPERDEGVMLPPALLCVPSSSAVRIPSLGILPFI